MSDLAHLSVQRCQRGKTPHAPSREDRARAFYALRAVPHGNNYQWPHLRAAEYAREQTADGRQLNMEF